jgi:regulator of cell morphogenesis and NO signaling
MTVIDPTMTLSALVNDHPQIAREFERRGLDYCCGGRQSLAEACANSGIDVATTSSELAAVVAEGDASKRTTMGAAELVEHLESTHHRYLWDEMPRITSLIDKIVSVHGKNHAELGDIAACYEQVRTDLEPHLMKEERVLFPMIRELAVADSPPSFHCGTLVNPISMMLREHDRVGELLARLRRLTSGYQAPADGCASYVACFAALAELEADTHLHIHKENNVLFPLVVRMESELTEQPSPLC